VASPNEWIQHNFTLTPISAASNSNNSFYLTFDKSGVSGGSLDFNLISLFPPTYKNRANGLRVDLAEALKALNGKFLRFPGGKFGHLVFRWHELTRVRKQPRR
jgi:alpha-N-arabinofuranosidase